MEISGLMSRFSCVIYFFMIVYIENELDMGVNNMAKILINHLASIRELEMDIKQINIFIGEQATGKSTLCKAVYYFRNFKEILLDYYYAVGQYGKNEKGLIKTLNSKLKDSFVSLFGYSWKLPADLSMKYCYTNDNYIQINLVHGQKNIFHYNIVRN